MAAGSFFVFCPLSSTSAKPTFRYTMITTGTNGTFSDRFPVYLSLDPKNIYIGFSAFLDAGTEMEFVSAELVSIPITEYQGESEDIFSEYLTSQLFTPIDLAGQHNRRRSADWKQLSLNQFKYDKACDQFCAVESGQQHDIGKGRCVISQQQLFLHFLFDLFHSVVFDVQPRINELKQNLISHYLACSIIRKREYAYYRELVADKATPDTMAIEKFSVAKKEFISNLKDKRSWLLYRHTDWFKTSIEEVKKIVFDKSVRNVDAIVERRATDLNEPTVTRFKRIGQTLTKANNEASTFFKDKLDYRSGARFLGISYHFFFWIVIVVFTGFFVALCLSGLLPGDCISMSMLAFSAASLPSMLILSFNVFSAWKWPKVVKTERDSFFPFMRFGIPIMVAWCAYIPVSEEAWVLTLNYSNWYILYFALFCFGTILTIELFRRYQVPEYKKRPMIRIHFNSIFLYGVGLSFSVLLGVIIMQFNAPKLIYDESQSFMPEHNLSTDITKNFTEYTNAKKNLHAFEKGVSKMDDTLHLSSLSLAEEAVLYRINKSNVINQFDTILVSNGIERALRCIDVNLQEGRHLISEIKKDSLAGYYKHFLQSFIKRYLNRLKEKPFEATYSLANQLGKENGLQFIAVAPWARTWFFFPRMLLLYSLMAFYIGFVVNFIIDSLFSSTK